MARRQRLTIFDFDGTLCRLATDYGDLRRSLEELAPGRSNCGLLELMLELEADPDVGRSAREVVDAAELTGLEQGSPVETVISRYRIERARGRTLIASHNGAPVILEFLANHDLPAPDQLFDRRRLAGSKEVSRSLESWLEHEDLEQCVVVGDSDADRRLAAKLGACFVPVEADSR